MQKILRRFCCILVKKGELNIDLEDEITKGTLLTRDNDVIHPIIREALGMKA